MYMYEVCTLLIGVDGVSRKNCTELVPCIANVQRHVFLVDKAGTVETYGGMFLLVVGAGGL